MDKNTKIRKGPLGLIGLLIVVIGIVAATTFSTIKDNLNLGLDLRGGFEILYEVEPLNEDASMDMNAVINSISKRINVLGVSEPSITVEGDNRVRVQLAGVADQESAREMIGTTANLTFRDVDDNELADSSILSEGGASLAYDENGKPVVSLKIKDSEKFGEITKEISEKTSGENIMIIWLDYTDCIWNRVSLVQLLSDSFKIDDIDVYRHTDTKYQRTDTGKCEYCSHQRVQSEYCPKICHKHDSSKHTWKTVADDQEQSDQSYADDTCHRSLFQRI